MATETLTGKELFEKYTKARDEYASTLLTIRMNIGDDIYHMLEKAEIEGKRLQINEDNLPDLWENFVKEDVIFV